MKDELIWLRKLEVRLNRIEAIIVRAAGGSWASNFPTRLVNANDAPTNADYTLLVDASGGVIVITLPTAAATPQIFNIKKIDATANTVTITPAGAETIDGATPVVIAAQWVSITIQADGSNWFIL